MSKKIITAAVATGLAVSGTQFSAEAVQPEEDLLFVELPEDAGGVLLIAPDDALALPDGIQPGTDDDFIEIDYAQTWGGGVGNDGVMSPGRNRTGVQVQTPQPRIQTKKPGQGITLDNGLKKQGRIKTDRKLKKKKKR